MSSSSLHHRSHERLRSYWESLRNERDYPSEGEINPDDLQDIWKSCFLISIDDVTQRLGYRYSYLGDELIDAFGDNIVNDNVAETLVSTSYDAMGKQLDKVLKERKPVMDEAEFINLKQLQVKYRACMLPLGKDEQTISHIIGCMRWKIY